MKETVVNRFKLFDVSKACELINLALVNVLLAEQLLLIRIKPAGLLYSVVVLVLSLYYK